MRRVPRHVVLVLATLVSACATRLVDVDAGATTDAALPELPRAAIGRVGLDGGLDLATAEPADFGCVGAAVRPPAVSTSTFTLELDDFASPSSPVPGISFCVFPDDRLPATPGCAPPATSFVTDAAGQAVITVPYPTWFSVEVTPSDGRLGAIAQHLTTTATGTVHRESFSAQENVLGVIPLISGADFVEGTAVMGGQVRDCGGSLVFGARVRLVGPDGNYVPLDTGGAVLAFFDGHTVPTTGRSFTHVDGTFAFANVPIPDGVGQEYFYEIWARIDDTSEPRVVACEGALGRPRSITTVQNWPLRVGEGSECPGLH